VQTRGYSLLLLSYIDSLEPNRQLSPVAYNEAINVAVASGECASFEAAMEKLEKEDPIDTVEKKMKLYASVRDQDGVSAISLLDSVVDFLLRSNLDTSAALANLILQFFTMQNDVIQSTWYLGRMQKLGYRASLGSLEKYQKLLARKGDTKKSEALRKYISDLGYMNMVTAEERTTNTQHLTQLGGGAPPAPPTLTAPTTTTAPPTTTTTTTTTDGNMIISDLTTGSENADINVDDVLLLKSTLQLQKQKTYMNRLLHYVSTSTKSVERGLSRYEVEWGQGSVVKKFLEKDEGSNNSNDSKE